LTIYSRRDLAPPRRHRRTGRRLLSVLLVLVVLAGAGYAVYHFTRSGSGTPAASRRHCVTPAAAPAPLPPRQVRLKVLNTTKRNGLAARVRTVLRRRGFRVLGVGNARPVVHGVVIRYPGAAGAPDGAVVTIREEFPRATLQPGGHRGMYEVELGRGFGHPATVRAAAAARTQDETGAHPTPVCSQVRS
jgi:hypothetical protein